MSDTTKNHRKFVGLPSVEMFEANRERFYAWDAEGQPDGDPAIRDLLRELNTIPGIATRWSCSSHGDDEHKVEAVLPRDRKRAKEMEKGFYVMLTVLPEAIVDLTDLFDFITRTIRSDVSQEYGYVFNPLHLRMSFVARLWGEPPYSMERPVWYTAVNFCIDIPSGRREKIIAAVMRGVVCFKQWKNPTGV